MRVRQAIAHANPLKLESDVYKQAVVFLDSAERRESERVTELAAAEAALRVAAGTVERICQQSAAAGSAIRDFFPADALRQVKPPPPRWDPPPPG